MCGSSSSRLILDDRLVVIERFVEVEVGELLLGLIPLNREWRVENDVLVVMAASLVALQLVVADPRRFFRRFDRERGFDIAIDDILVVLESRFVVVFLRACSARSYSSFSEETCTEACRYKRATASSGSKMRAPLSALR